MQKKYSYQELQGKISKLGNQVFVISGKTFELSGMAEKLLLLNHPNIARFSEFSENPRLEDLIKAQEIYNKNQTSLIIAIGGGTAIDLAKLVKYYSSTPLTGDEIEPILPKPTKSIEFVAIPSTFGTGSESTHFAVLYIKGKKFSVADTTILPDGYLLDGRLAETLPKHVKGAACLDALCQAIESYWSVNANQLSKQYSSQAISIIVNNYKNYMAGNISVANEIALAANLAGNAINITKTTAAHALSYALTSQYGLSHGHAVALCIKNMFVANMLKAKIDGLHKVCETMKEIFYFLEINDGEAASVLIHDYLSIAGLAPSLSDFRKVSNLELELVANSVNVERMSNHPVCFSFEEIIDLFD